MEGDSATAYRAMVARANFLAIDRPDIAFSVKEICRRMSAPSEGDHLALKRLGRYLQGAPRLVHRFDWQDNPGQITVMTDSDWAGCPRTRMSTTGGLVLRGAHVLKRWSTTQVSVALSSGEAELVSAVRGRAGGWGSEAWRRTWAADRGLPSSPMHPQLWG